MAPAEGFKPQRELAMPPQQKTAIGYIRVSTAREEMISPELQETAIRDWARRNERRIVRIVSDLDATGRNFKRRIQEAIQAIVDNEADEIIVWKFSRFGRQRLGWAVHLDMVESAGGGLVSATEEVDAHTAAGRFTRGMLAEVAAFESDRASEQWKETHAYRVGVGLPATGTPRWGYIRRGRVPVPGEKSHYKSDPNDPDGERYDPDADLIDVYISLYERFVSGEGGPTLIKWLNHNGFRTVRGAYFTIEAIYRLLDSGFAAGYLREHNKECRCTQRARCTNVNYVKGAQRAIISEDLWRRYLERRAAQRVLSPRERAPNYPLSGLLVCGGCLAKMTTISRSRNNPAYAYRCGHYLQTPECTGAYVPRWYAEKCALEELERWAVEIEQTAAQLSPRNIVRIPSAEDEATRLGAEIAKIDRALVRLKKLRALDEADDAQAEDEYIQARNEFRADRELLLQQLAVAQTPEATSPEDYGPVIRGLLEEWSILAAAKKKALLHSVFREIKVHRAGKRQKPNLEIIPVWASTPTSHV